MSKYPVTTPLSPEESAALGIAPGAPVYAKSAGRKRTLYRGQWAIVEGAAVRIAEDYLEDAEQAVVLAVGGLRIMPEVHRTYGLALA